VTVSAPWLIASRGHGSYRFLPQLAAVIASSGPVMVFAALLTALLTVLVARVTAKGADPLPRRSVPPRAARLAATTGTAVIALSLVSSRTHRWRPGSRPRSAAEACCPSPETCCASGCCSAAGRPGDHTARQLAAVPSSRRAHAGRGVVGTAAAARPAHADHGAGDGGRRGLRNRAGAAGEPGAHMAMDDTVTVWGPVYPFSKLGDGVPAALTFGITAGMAALATLRLAGDSDTRTSPR
jgi:hypothetical protein